MRTYVSPPPRCRVYRFGVVWHWKCSQPLCAGGRDRGWDGALARANAHVLEHEQQRQERQRAITAEVRQMTAAPAALVAAEETRETGGAH